MVTNFQLIKIKNSKLANKENKKPSISFYGTNLILVDYVMLYRLQQNVMYKTALS